MLSNLSANPCGALSEVQCSRADGCYWHDTQGAEGDTSDNIFVCGENHPEGCCRPKWRPGDTPVPPVGDVPDPIKVSIAKD